MAEKDFASLYGMQMRRLKWAARSENAEPKLIVHPTYEVIEREETMERDAHNS